MASPAPNDVPRNSIPPAPLPPSTNNTSLSHSLKRLSISTASSTALPSSPRTSSPSRLGNRNGSTSSPNAKAPPTPLRRSSSSMSLDARASTPTLLRKASMNSLHGVGGVTPSRQSPSRRTSSAQIVNASTLASKSPLSEIEVTEPPRPRHTAESIASNHFKTELDLHHGEEEPRPADTIAIIHDACYGHRFSRPRTSKASLSTIVERPERIQASILGLSVAYVRLGERHSEGQFPLHPSRDATSIPSTPFKIQKTTRRLPLSSQAVTNVHGVKWMEELKIMCDNAEARLAMNGKELARPDIVRSPDQGAPAKFHEGDLYLCSESLNAMEGALGAVCEGVDSVFNGSASGKGPHRAFVTIRPPGHHCSASYPSGFCWVNNVHVGISHAALTHGLTHAAIIDFDLHHGDGSQAIAWDHNRRANGLAKNALPWKKTSIGYFSLHDINSYPCEMGDEEKVKNASLCIENAHGQSIWNVHLLPWKSESEFWDLYETKYSILLEKTRSYLRAQTERLRASTNGPKPKAAIFLSAGFDASEWESSGMQRHKVNVPTEFYARLTRDVVRLAAEEGTGAEGRVISVLEGGYSDRALCSGVFSHISGMVSGTPLVIQKEANHSGLGYEMGQKIGAFNGTESLTAEPVSSGVQTYDPLWWSLAQLEHLETTVNPTLPVPEPKKPRDGPAPTYSSPTQSFIAKVTSPSARRTVSTMSSTGSPRPLVSRAPSPPPPEVPWTVAAHELSKLLIPSDRQTGSCKPEDLSAEATRARRDRQSILTPPTTTEASELPNQRMALRTRKPAKSTIDTVEEDGSKLAARASRRKTVTGAAVLAAEKAVSRGTTPMPELSYAKPTAQSSRRLSLASNTGSVASEVSRPDHQRVPSNGSVAPQHRPETSQSIRPDSSLSSRGHSIPPIVVKKTRVPSQPRAEPAKTSRVRRKSPLNEGDSAPAQDSTAGLHSRSTSVILPNPPPASQTSDIDSLTSGMRKIKLSLTTKAQREAKEQSGQASKSAASKAKPATKAVASKGVKSRSSAKEIAPLPSKTEPSLSDSNATMVTTSKDQPQGGKPSAFVPPAETLDPVYTSIPPQNIAVPKPDNLVANVPVFGQTYVPQPPPTAPASSASDNTDVFIPYQPEGPTQDTVVKPEHLRWLPPNTATPSPMKRGELPVFTSTSAIPFGLNPHKAIASGQPPGDAEMPDIKPKQDGEVDIWEIPETPQK